MLPESGRRTAMRQPIAVSSVPPCCPLRVLLHVNEGCKRVYWQGDRMPDAAAGIMLTVIGYIIRNLWGVEDESAGYVRGSFWGI